MPATETALLMLGEPRPFWPEDEYREILRIAHEVAVELGETQRMPRKYIQRFTKRFGRAFVLRHLECARAVEASGGLLRKDGMRRTLGGVFFQLVQAELGVPLFMEVTRKSEVPPKRLRWLQRQRLKREAAAALDASILTPEEAAVWSRLVAQRASAGLNTTAP